MTDPSIAKFRKYFSASLNKADIEALASSIVEAQIPSLPPYLHPHVRAFCDQLPVYIAALALADPQVNEISMIMPTQWVSGKMEEVRAALMAHLSSGDTRRFIAVYAAHRDELGIQAVTLPYDAVERGNGWALLAMRRALTTHDIIWALYGADTHLRVRTAALLLSWWEPKDRALLRELLVTGSFRRPEIRALVEAHLKQDAA
jgi:hypothetical protein